MRGLVPPDPEGGVSRASYAVVYAPNRRRNRFAAGCVELHDTREAAIEAASPTENRYPARVLGPSKSSEGQRIYYLLQWLE